MSYHITDTYYLFLKYNEPLAYLGFLITYIYIYCGVFFTGFFIGKVTVRFLDDLSFKTCFCYQ